LREEALVTTEPGAVSPPTQPDNLELWRRYWTGIEDSYLLPNEFVVRSFLGTYPNLRMQRNYRGAMACDVSCGDGRNLTVLHKLGMKLHGTEVSADICNHTMRKLRASPERIEADIRPGLNWAIPFADGSFDYVLSWNAIYYMRDAHGDIREHVREFARVMKPGAWLVVSVPTPNCFSLQGAEELGNGLIRIVSPYRSSFLDGAIYRRFASFEDIEAVFGSHFGNFQRARIADDCFGIALDYFVFVCQRQG
jgi:SAM-dependent methyltransferase